MSAEPEIEFDDPKNFEEKGRQNRESQIKKLGKKSNKLSAAKLRTLWCLLLSIGVNQTLYMNVSSLLPPYALKNYCIDETQVGVILW